MTEYSNLSPKHLEVIKALCAVGDNKSIARLLHITEHTVKVHIRTIQLKLKLKNRVLIAVWAVRNGHD